MQKIGTTINADYTFKIWTPTYNLSKEKSLDVYRSVWLGPIRGSEHNATVTCML